MGSLAIHWMFKDGNVKIIEVNEEEKAKNKNSIPYNVCWAEMHPGYSSLRFILSSTPRHHPIGISPNGFVWGVKTFKSLDLLLNEFKKNPRGTPSNKQVKTSRWGNKRQLVPPHLFRLWLVSHLLRIIEDLRLLHRNTNHSW